MKFVVESLSGVASRVVIGGHELLFDQPSSIPGGEDRGPSPLDVMAASVAGCAHYFAAGFLFARKLSAEGLVVSVEAEKASQPSPRLSQLTLRVSLPSDVPARYLPAIERAIRNCPAYGTLIHPPEVKVEISQPTGASDPLDVSAAAGAGE
jgi:putative redox protein